MKKIIKMTLLILNMAVIYFFSSQSQVQSSNTSNYIIEILYSLIGPFISMNINEFIEYIGQFIRSLAHFTEFFVLGIISYSNACEYLKNHSKTISIIFCIIYALSDEIHQLFVSGRLFDIKDICIDCLGSIIGIFFIYLIYKKCQKKLS